MKTKTFLLLLLAVLPLAAQTQPDIANDNLVLVPVFFSGAGGHGSQWTTDVNVWSTSTSSADLEMPVPLLESPSSGCIDLDGFINAFAPRPICEGFESPAGLLLYVPKTVDPHDVQVQARISDTTHSVTSAGTQIPVVRESEFRDHDFLLTNIPSDPRFRANLRIYGLTEIVGTNHSVLCGGQTVPFTIYDSRDTFLDHFPIAQGSLTLSAPQAGPTGPLFIHPAYASIGDLVAAFPQLANVPSYDIRIHAVQTLADPPRTLTYWGFVTLTNNETQEVTAIAP